MATYCITLIEMTSNNRVSARAPASPERRDFIREIVAADVREGRVSEVVTRFPPEPNGYLHLGHPKAIALNFGIAQELGGRCHLRFDDTNPIKEEQEYIDSIQEDIRWLGFDWGEHLDMASPNINMRDPVLYRILHATHPRTGDEWCIYPLYDFAHGQSDAIEGITHSLCTLEFEDHRPLYDWLIENLPVPSRPHQYEFARLNFTY